jgi:hypothetical protein
MIAPILYIALILALSLTIYHVFGINTAEKLVYQPFDSHETFQKNRINMAKTLSHP